MPLALGIMLAGHANVCSLAGAENRIVNPFSSVFVSVKAKNNHVAYT